MPVYDGKTVYVEDRELYEQFTTESTDSETDVPTSASTQSAVPIVETDMTDLDYTEALAVPDAEPFASTILADASPAEPDATQAAVAPVFALEVFPNAEHHPILSLADTEETDIFFATDAEMTGYILVGARNRTVLTECATQCETVKRVLPGTCSPFEAAQALPGNSSSESPPIRVSDTVKITQGPFQGSLALVDGVGADSEEAQVILEGGMVNLPVNLPVDHLERAQSTLEL